MKILHTADWHLNDKLRQQDRTQHLRSRVEQIAEYLRPRAGGRLAHRGGSILRPRDCITGFRIVPPPPPDLRRVPLPRGHRDRGDRKPRPRRTDPSVPRIGQGRNGSSRATESPWRSIRAGQGISHRHGLRSPRARSQGIIRRTIRAIAVPESQQASHGRRNWYDGQRAK